MSTSAWIAKVNDDRTISGVYCQSEGYVEYTGNTLISHWDNGDMVDTLISGGDIHLLGKESESQDHLLSQTKDDLDSGYDSSEHEATVWDNEYEFKFGLMESTMIAFVYLFKNGKWLVLDSANSSRFVAISDYTNVNKLKSA